MRPDAAGAEAEGEHVLAIDIGGTKMAVAIVDGDGTILDRRQRATAADGTGDDLFRDLADLLDELVWRTAAPVACGVGCGGPMTARGATVSPVNIPAWRRFPLHGRLAELTGIPVFVDNDAKALALGEGWKGAAIGVSDFIGMVVSTGVGGGIVLDGRLLDGAQGNAGHIGHVVVAPQGRMCACGGRGCLEAEASGTAIAAITGRPPKDATAETVERAGRLVGLAVASVANLLDLELAVVAGSVALGFGEPFFAAAQAEIDERARLEFSRGAVIRPASLASDGPLVGAAAVGWSGLGRRVLADS
jgi:glucokinase